ncbi:MAG: bZIP transcription factor [Candidatus Hodarchaeota archaeon]
MNQKNTIALLCEPCPLCNQAVPLLIHEKTLQTGPNGLTPVLDSHGLFSEIPHARILHVDKEKSVRAWEVIPTVTLNKKILTTKAKMTSMQEEIVTLQKQVMKLKNDNNILKKQLKDLLNEKKVLKQHLHPSDLLKSDFLLNVKAHSDEK